MMPTRLKTVASFTLIELLAVIAIIAILAGLTLSAFSGVMNSAGRSRARTEIAAISAALESYKADNGAYPLAATFTDTNGYTADGAAAPNYEQGSQLLYQALAGETNFVDSPPIGGTKIYMTFKSSQLGNYTSGGGEVYIKDPFGNSYGYYTGAASPAPTGAAVPVNGLNQFDLWSTGGDVLGKTNTWISNWGMGG